MYNWIEINCEADLEKLVDKIPSEYNPKRVADTIKSAISGAVKAILVEHNYVDKDYRSTFYNFYSKKGRRYSSRCVRLHFFDESVEFDSAIYRFSGFGEALDHHYFGYMVLRPTGICTIGRSVLSPDIRTGVHGWTITAKHKVHLLGYTLIVRGFPSMDQHNYISVCAHAACWSILRHYSERYTMHKEYLVHDITMMAQHYDPGGLLPSKGLEISHAERVFQESGTYPIHVARQGPDAASDPRFYRQLTAYIESGIPLFAANHADYHAFAVVGCNRRTPVTDPATQERYAWDELQSLIVVDDNYLPYLSIPANSATTTTHYSAEDIDSFIVPLPEKVHYPADAVDILAASLRSLSGLIELPEKDNTIVRYFITTGSAYRRFVRDKVSEFDPNLLKVAMTLPFAQFLWVVEYSTPTEWASGQIAARAVIDATASIREPMPLWLFHNRERALVFNRKDGDFSFGGLQQLTLQGMENTALSRMDQNLRTIKSK